MSSTIDLGDLFNYADQPIPDYITQDNTTDNPITDEGATLGRVLFYDKNLSANLAVSCADCHHQNFGFGDTTVQSVGFDGRLTARHSMRLINARFNNENRFFWDERASSLENQVSQPIQDHIEMGFSGIEGNPDFEDFIERLEGLTYYQDLFTFVYGDAEVTEQRVQLALAQFIRSIQSFDSRYDEGLSQVNNGNQPFPNFTIQENEGKQLYMSLAQDGGAGCVGCHQPPEFSIAINSHNNGVIDVPGGEGGIDLTITRAPSLRDLINPEGLLNGPLMHTGEFNSLLDVIEHYDNGVVQNPNLDNRLIAPDGTPIQLGLSDAQKNAIVAFLETLTGSNVYTDEKWSNPFDQNGIVNISGGPVATEETSFNEALLVAYPNPVADLLTVRQTGESKLYLTGADGRVFRSLWFKDQITFDVSSLPSGLYILRCENEDSGSISLTKVVVR